MTNAINATTSTNPSITANPTVTSAPSISSSAMFVELSISTWTGRKLDKRATKETLDNHAAASNTGSFHKKLLGDCAELDAIHKFAGNVRSFHYHSTMPWSDMGMRLLPTAAYAEYHKDITGMEVEFWDLVNKFLVAYQWAVTEAQAKLGSLFNPDDYPTADNLRTKFKFRYAYQLIPDAGDFRLNINNEAAEYLQQQYQQHYDQQLTQAMNDVWQRTYDALKHMSEKIDYPDKEDKATRKIFRDSLVDNVRDMMGLLIKFNITNDKKLDDMRVALEDAMFGVSPEALREDDDFRAETKRKVDAVLANMKW